MSVVGKIIGALTVKPVVRHDDCTTVVRAAPLSGCSLHQSAGNAPTRKETTPTVIAAMLVIALVASCDSGKNKRTVFVFPQGDVVRGQQAFTALKCYECHRIEGVAGLPGPTVSPEKVVVLGGEVAMPRNYGELITSVIHPKYARTTEPVGPTEQEIVMPDFNQKMTVSQMLDIVTFLHAHYKKLKPLYYDDYYGP